MNAAEQKDISLWVHRHVGRFSEVQPVFRLYAQTLQQVLAETCRKLAPLAIVQTRPKAIPSFAEKIVRKQGLYKDPLIDMTDLCGGRVIVHTADQVRAVCEFIEEQFHIDWANSDDVGQRLRATEFGYRSVHYIVTFKRAGRLHKDIPVDVPDALLKGLDPANREQGLKAEIQVRTVLEHAWAAIAHDITYKGDFKVPEKYLREFAALAAVLESADREFGLIYQSLQAYQSNYGKYLEPEQVKSEIDKLELVLEHDRANVDLAARIATLAMTIGDWQKAIDTLSPYEDTDHPSALRILGIALSRRNADQPAGNGHRAARRCLEAATRPPRQDPESLCELGDWWSREDEDKARGLYRQAFELDPTDPACLARFLEYEIACQRSSEMLGLLAPTIAAACNRCRNQIGAGVNLPWAHLHLGKFQLLLGKPLRALAAVAKAVELCPGPFLLEAAQKSLRHLRSIADRLAGYDWVATLVLLAQAVQEWKPDPNNDGTSPAERKARKEFSEAARSKLDAMASPEATPLSGRVAIVAGGCDESIRKQMESYRQLLTDGFKLFEGTIISGGTREGIAGLVGDLREHYGPKLHTIGYIPANTPNDATVDRDPNRYDEIRSTAGSGFTPLEPLQNWIDLVASGVEPREVRLLGVNGGEIAAVEYRIAAALGARVALVDESGREADRLFSDPDWCGSANIIRLPRDPMSLHAFLSAGTHTLGDQLADQLAPEIHETFRRERQRDVARQDRSLTDWEDLTPSLKDSNRAQARHILEKLRAIGCRAEPAGDDLLAAFEFTDDELERLAEMEHGRWNVERLLAGWRYGETKDIDRKISPYLVPWDRLPDSVKHWDRIAVQAIPALLAKVHLRICRE